MESEGRQGQGEDRDACAIELLLVQNPEFYKWNRLTCINWQMTSKLSQE